MRRALGKGLSQLLADSVEDSPTKISVESIVPNTRQPRSRFVDDSIEELAASITEHGVIQPLIVRPLANDQYELIAGERRLRASKLAGLEEVPVVIRAASAQASLEIALIENVQREDISAIECAMAYKRLAEEFDMNQEQIAQRVGKSRVSVTNTLRLLKLPQAIQDGLLEGLITEGHARALLTIESPVRQAALFERIMAEKLSVREAENIARMDKAVVNLPLKREKNEPELEPEWTSLQNGLSEYFGSPVKLSKDKKGGQVAIQFYSDEDLQRILDILGVSL